MVWPNMVSPNFKGEPSYEMAEQSIIKSSNAMIAIIRLVRINKTKIFGALLIPFIWIKLNNGKKS